MNPLGPLEVRLNGESSGRTFVIVSSQDRPLPARLTLRTEDGSEGEVSLRTSQGSVATLSISPSTVEVSSTPVEVQVLATTPSSGGNDTAVEVVQGTEVLAQFEVTAVAAPLVRFRGRFQCRLATDNDDWDEEWGKVSSFGLYAVQGPDRANPDEPPLDRIIRFQDAVALRPLCAPIGVKVLAIEAEVGGSRVRFAGDPLIGQPVNLGPDCKFDARDETYARYGFEPISDFRLTIGSVFAGASAPAEPRLDRSGPPPSTAPYADGIFRFDIDLAPWPPSEFGFREPTWTERSWAVVARKLAQLVAQRPTDDRAARIRDRRLREHAFDRLTSIKRPIMLMERYTGLIDCDLTIGPDPVGALAYLGGLPAIEFYAEFLDFDTDCQTGMVNGTLGAPIPREPAPPDVQAKSSLRRSEPLDE